MLLTLLSFAFSVSITRLFLELTGYPKLGSGGLHIAHVLWGGLILFGAALLPIILANRWVYLSSAILAGAGVGLFIDEVGKFLTQSNDYFYPPAAPIIYAFFLITVLIYIQVRRPTSREPRNELYHALDTIEEVLDRDLDVQERDELDRRLLWIAAQFEQYPDFASLANELHQFLQNQDALVRPDKISVIEQWQNRLRAWSIENLDRAKIRVGIVLGLFLATFIALFNWVKLIVASSGTTSLNQTLEIMSIAESSNGNIDVFWLYLRIFLEGGVGVLLLTGSLLIIAKKVRWGMNIGYYGLLLSLTTVDLLLFYIYQFSTILVALFQFIILMAIIYYRKGNPKEENECETPT